MGKECEKKTLKEAIDVLVDKIDGPKKPDEAARKFFKMVKKDSESLFACMYALRVLAEQEKIPSEAVAQRFLADLAPEICTAISKDNEGKNYKRMDVDRLLNLARQEENMIKPVIASYEATANVKVLEAEECKVGSSSTANTEARAAGNEAVEAPLWFHQAMDKMVAKLDDRYLWKDDGKPGNVSNFRKAKVVVIKAEVGVLDINLPPEVRAEVVKVPLILS